jgi:hypothetical protein
MAQYSASGRPQSFEVSVTVMEDRLQALATAHVKNLTIFFSTRLSLACFLLKFEKRIKLVSANPALRIK